ncbi:DUF4190 domain-containing protein [Frigoribacterium sp. CG_9.8]|uniref:DUF4190 domain-containing protein n=1 Tax=Frigoribacterium sp. CG_9.8 TaxID=2787733 RepID=UPI0018C9D116|nr:DUF4190 domain-containing protein [Frigoribacterium sp. CG_9.8]MBG6108927.1 hypothetical protein [Frigoribacterium sp. CG_9.8]
MTDPDNGAVPPVPPPASPVTPPPAPPLLPPAPPAGGYVAPPPYTATGGVATPKTLSLIGMILGIVGILGSGVVIFPIVGSVLQLFIPGGALVLGILGRKREGPGAKGFWLTAIITGIVGLAIAIIALIGWIALIAIGIPNGAFDMNNMNGMNNP